MTTHEGGPDPLGLLAELRELVSDIGQWLEWTRDGGADVLPREPALSADEVAALKARPAVTPPQPAARRSGAPLPRPSFQRPSVTPAAPENRRQPSLGNWGQFVRGSPEAAGSEALAQAGSLGAIRADLGDCQRCGLCRGRRNIVFGVGNENADLMIVGEGPGANEDRQGEPFVGNAGQMLDKMLVNVIGLQRSQVYIANVVKCRPPDNRNPEPEEVARCRPYLMAQMRVIQPKVVLVLGSVASRALFQTSTGITRLRGEWRELSYAGGSARAMATFHPAYLLRNPAEKRKTFEDLKKVQAALKG